MRFYPLCVFLLSIFGANVVNAADCSKERQAVDLIRQSASVTAVISSSHVGASVRIDWAQPGLTTRLPAYLIIASDAPVRFVGTGLYALTPEAEAPFKIPRFAGRTRAIIPLYGKAVALKGSFELVPLIAGTTTLSWDVVSYDNCGANISTSNLTIPLTVSAGGRPSLIIGDPFASTGNVKTYVSADRKRLIEIEEGRYRLLDADSGAEVAERAATDPRFSPTGRFVGAQEQDGFVVLDAIDGAHLTTISNAGDIAWDNADSFVVAGGPQAGLIQTVNTLAPSTQTYGGSWLAARCCSAVDDVAYRHDLENNLAVFSGPLGVIVNSLSDDGLSFNETMKINGEIKRARAQALQFARETSAVRAFALPKMWESRDRLIFSHLGLPPLSERTPSQKALSRFLLEPKSWTGARFASVASGAASADQISRSAWTNPSTVALELAHTKIDRFIKQLGDFGFAFLPVRTPAQTIGKFEAGYQKEMPKSEAVRVTTQIGSENPNVAKKFKYIETNGMQCQTENSDGLNSNINIARKWAIDAKRSVWLTWLGCTEGNAAFNRPNLYIFDTARNDAFRFEKQDGRSLLENAEKNAAPACDYTVDSCLASAELQGGRYVVLTSHEGQAFAIFDLESRSVFAKRFNLSRGQLLSRVLMAADAKHATQINSDGTFFVYRLAGGAQVLAGRVFDDEVVVALPDGRFDATPEGAEMMRLRFPGRPGEHALAQFSSKLRVPGLLTKAISDQPLEVATAVNIPPQLTAKIVRSNNGLIQLDAKVNGSARAVSLRVYQDGVFTAEHPYSESGSFVVTFPALPGARWVSVVAVDADGVFSAPVGRDIGDSAGTKRGTRIVAAGINQYDDTRIQKLEAPKRDAEAFVRAVAGLSDGGTNTSILLSDQEASPARLKSVLAREIDASGPGDTVMLFFAGHGVRDESGRLYLATSGTRIDDIPGTALSWDEIATILSRARGRVAILLDTCHSGAAGTGFFATNDAAAGTLLANMKSNIVIFSASKGRELALETSEGGMFTRALVDVITSERSNHDLNGNGVIELSELYRGVKSKVRAMSSGQQTPWFARNQMVGDFALF